MVDFRLTLARLAGTLVLGTALAGSPVLPAFAQQDAAPQAQEAAGQQQGTPQEAVQGTAPDAAQGDAHDAAKHVAEGVAAETAEHAKGGLPQLNPDTYPTQIFWLAVTFGLLLFLMSKVALPRVAEVLEARQEKIADDLDRATALKAEADAVIQNYERELTEARARAQKVLSDATLAAESETAQRLGELAADLAERARAAETRIEQAKRAALGNVRGVAAETAVAAVARLAGLQLDAATADAAVEEALNRVGKEVV